MSKTTEVTKDVTILFAGDSGDGIQLTGTQFTNTTALFGNDLSTFPNFPAEIRGDCIVIPDDHVIVEMASGLGASAKRVRMPFNPERGAYSDHGHSHD